MLLSSHYRFVDGAFSGTSGDLNNEEVGLSYIDPKSHYRLTIIVSTVLRFKCPISDRMTTANGRFFCYVPYSSRAYGFFISGKLEYGVIIEPPLVAIHSVIPPTPDPYRVLMEAVISSLS
jgi:hypothetical protein